MKQVCREETEAENLAVVTQLENEYVIEENTGKGGGSSNRAGSLLPVPHCGHFLCLCVDQPPRRSQSSGLS